MFIFIRDFKDEVPGACAKDCGNYLDMNLPMANWLANRFLNDVLENISDERLVYAESFHLLCSNLKLLVYSKGDFL